MILTILQFVLGIILLILAAYWLRFTSFFEAGLLPVFLTVLGLLCIGIPLTELLSCAPTE